MKFLATFFVELRHILREGKYLHKPNEEAIRRVL
jgi:hypothetical protein